jgi:superfamily I DNA/RNA helicase
MNLTQEQSAIIQAKEPSFKINAIAGSGKTTTLLEYAKHHQHLNILYLAYNKSLQTSIEKKLKEYDLKHMKVSTIHALAYGKTQGYGYKLCHDLKISVLEECLIRYEAITNGKTNYYPIAEYLALIKDLVNFYCNSSLIALDEKLLSKYKSQSNLGSKLLDLLSKHEQRVLTHLKHILSSMKNHHIHATHDFYLKMFYLNKQLCQSLNYDLILVDEAQDISDVMIAIVEAQKCSRIYIGDAFQQIYSFRYAINALQKIDLPQYELSHSFRFGDNFAKTLQNNLNELYKMQSKKQLNLNGLPITTRMTKVDTQKPYAVIARTTFGLVQELVHHIHSSKKIFFEGGYASYSFMNQTVYSIFYLKEKKFDKITLNEIKEFESIFELEQFAKETKNQDYLNVIKFINAYGDNIFEINKKIKERLTQNKHEAQIIFTTTHKSKGLEYDQVLMANDFISKKEISNPKNNLSFLHIIEELNIYYVAATRAKKVIELANLHLNYTPTPNNDAQPLGKHYTKRESTSKMKNLQEQWLKKNRVKKSFAF